MGGGVKVCKRWRLSFKAFLEDMGMPLTDKHTLDRFPDKDGDYKPGNVRWATRREQANNRRSNRTITFKGLTKTLTEWAREAGLSVPGLEYRLEKGLTMKEALSRPRRHGVRLCDS